MRRVRVRSWAVQGNSNPQFPFLVTPWEAFPIWIRGMEATLLNGTSRAMFTCNNANPDIFAMAGDGERRCEIMLQDDLVLPFPAAGGQDPPHLDIHIEFASYPWFLVYTAFYNDATEEQL